MSKWFALVLVCIVLVFTVHKLGGRPVAIKELNILKAKEYERGFSDGKYYCEFMNARQSNLGCKNE